MSNQAKNSVSVIIPTRNGADTIGALLNGLARQKWDGPVETVIVDSASIDETVEIVRSHGVEPIKITPDDFHHAGTRNMAARESTGHFLVFLNQDAVPIGDNWLAELLEPLTSGENIGAVYGRQCYDDGINAFNKFRLDWHYGSESVTKHRNMAQQGNHKLYFFSTANCATTRAIWERYPFSENLPIFEDTIFARTLIQNNYAIRYSATAAVLHYHNFGAIDLFKRYFDMGFVQQRLQFVENVGKSQGNESVRFFMQGAKWLVGSGRLLALANFIFVGFWGFMGLLLGRNASRVPFFIRRHLGLMTNKSREISVVSS